MITFSRLGQYGRLGNQLFQYAALKGLSIKKGYDIGMMENMSSSVWHGQKCLLSNFNLNYPLVNSFGRVYNQPGDSHAFDDNFFDLEDGVDLCGFFQNLNYFHFAEKEIKEDLKIKPEIQRKCDEYLDRFSGEVVSVHIRRGDNIQLNQSNQEVIDEYVSKSVKYFNDEVTFLVFTGGSRNKNEDNTEDINYLKEVYQGDNVYFSETNDPMMDFCLITKCHHNIMSHDSTFGWWASYLNEKDNSTVICPKHYWSYDQSIEYNNFYPDNWRIME